MADQCLTVEEIRAFPATVPVSLVGRAFGLGRDAAYRAARSGTLPVPVPVQRIGERKLYILRSDLLAALGVSEESGRPSNAQLRVFAQRGPRDALPVGRAGRE